MSNKPRYQQIKSYILDGIEQQKYTPGSRIPTEHQLAEQFGVSRMTVNKAIRDLVQEHLLVRYPGLGTFITDAKAESPLAEIRNIAEEVRQRGHDYSCHVMKLEETAANETVAMQMGMPIGTRVYHSVIVHLENNLPIQLEDRFVAAALVPGYIGQDFTQATPNEYLSKNCPISSIEHIVEAVLPDARVQKLLEIDSSTPCIQVGRRTWSDGRLISFACLTHPGPRYKLRSITTLNV
ncbi:GntR family transcriptional regulator [Marinobacter lipolyticus SM19]|uniref:Histidine utilization repressor n=1 Tax=Marinobacter lipolyticus SM19 TaxID=1318628 RepID=R8B572_9GAMM|nr:histidine utilization repressor [Marinobacter lipolyticus]EON93654.1 GntR family transcriptional regulator [Marinobacter lipolyticus SM19]